MSSINFCTAELRNAARSSGRAFARSTGCPIRATFRMDINDDYMHYLPGVLNPGLNGATFGSDHGAGAGSPFPRRGARLSVLPPLRQLTRTAFAEADGTGPARLHDVRLRFLPGPEDCRRHDHPDGRPATGAR